MIIRSFLARLAPRASAPARRIVFALITASAALTVTSCTHNLYQFPLYNFAGRPVPPSSLQQRVMVGVSYNGSAGGLIILDALRDLRNNLQNTIPGWSISGFSGSYPSQIISFPEQLRAYVYSGLTPFPVNLVNYSTESSSGAVGTFGGPANSIAIAPNFQHVYAAIEGSSQLVVIDNVSGGTYALNLPNVYKVAVNTGDTVALAMVRNSNALYRVIKLNTTAVTTAPPGAVDCEPTLLPVYCVVPVPGNYDRPTGAIFSLDGSNTMILNCGIECGGGTNGGAGISIIPQAALLENLIPASTTYPNPVTQTVSIPGGVTVALLDSNNLYTAGQSYQNGLFGGNLTITPLSTMVPGPAIPISDGSHNKLLFADDNTLWIGSQSCANGVRQALAASGSQSQSANYNCLTRYTLGTGAILPTWAGNTAYSIGDEVTDGVNTQVVQTAGTSGGSTPTWKSTLDGATTEGSVVWVNIGPTTRAQVYPVVTPNNNASTALTVPFPNTDQNQMYYGSLTGLCWVQNYHKIYTAYGGQVHAFYTLDGREINNVNIIVQGTALDVAYMDALTNTAN